jgi:hypothetical protein
MPDLSRLGVRSGGVWTRPQTLAVMSPGAVDTQVRLQHWQVLWSGVYTDAGHLPDAEQRAWAAVLAAGGAAQPVHRRLTAVACGRTAARVWGLPLIDDEDPATGRDEHRLDDVAVARHLPPQARGERRLVPHRTVVARDELVRLPSGLWITSPLRTVVDCAALLRPDALTCLLDAALHAHRVLEEQVQAAVVSRPGRRGTARLRTAAALADRRAESPAETLARLLLVPVLPDLEPQVRVLDGSGRIVVRVDLGDRRVRLAVEADGKAGHAGAAMVAKDRRRDRVTEGLGWCTERVTWYELRRQQAAFVQRVVGRHRQLARRDA